MKLTEKLKFSDCSKRFFAKIRNFVLVEYVLNNSLFSEVGGDRTGWVGWWRVGVHLYSLGGGGGV